MAFEGQSYKCICSTLKITVVNSCELRAYQVCAGDRPVSKTANDMTARVKRRKVGTLIMAFQSFITLRDKYVLKVMPPSASKILNWSF